MWSLDQSDGDTRWYMHIGSKLNIDTFASELLAHRDSTLIHQRSVESKEIRHDDPKEFAQSLWTYVAAVLIPLTFVDL